jgi:hypothetical protein
MTDVLGKFLEQEGGEEVDSTLAFVNAKQLDLRQIIVAGLRALKSEVSDSDVLSNSYSRGTPTFDHYASQQPFSMVPTVSSLPTLFSNGIFLHHHALHQTYDQNACATGLSLEAIMRPNCTSPFNASSSIKIALPLRNSIPPDLRPTPTQIHFPHHPFIALIPFP